MIKLADNRQSFKFSFQICENEFQSWAFFVIRLFRLRDNPYRRKPGSSKFCDSGSRVIGSNPRINIDWRINFYHFWDFIK